MVVWRLDLCIRGFRIMDKIDFKKDKKDLFASRERVKRCFNREKVDRMPIDLGVHYSTGINMFAYWNLRQYLGLSTDNIEIADTVQFLARVDEDILQRFHCDCILLQPNWPTTKRWNPREEYEFVIPGSMIPEKNDSGDWIVKQLQPDGSEWSMRMPKGGFFFDGHWISNFHKCSEDEFIIRTAKEAERIYKETNYATMYHPGFAGFIGGDIYRMMEMVTDPQKIIAENDEICKSYLVTLEKAVRKIGPFAQVVSINEDYGVQDSLVCNPELIEKCCMPFMKKITEFVHKNTDWKVFLHSCGSVKPLIPALIDAGIDILNPVQISAGNMNPKELKDEFGDKIIFWGGGCDTQNILGVKKPQEVSQNVRELINIFKPSGGFVFNPVHNIMGNVPPENVVTMYDTAYENSFYN